LGGLLGLIIEGLPTVPVAADLNLSQTWFTAIVVVVGFVHGANGVALKEGPGILGLIGLILFWCFKIGQPFI